jgi:HAE1 family hydrophobic/amphiphilic exporter-1
VRHLERGERPVEAALAASREIGFTIVSMTLSLAAVFIPVLFMGGIMGRLFREFAVTICVAILISGIVSVTLTPMLCSRFLKPPRQKRGLFHRATERFFDGMLRVYDVSLRWVLRHRPVMVVVFVIVLVATVHLYTIVPKGFIPEADNDQLAVITEAAPGTSYTLMEQYQKKVMEVIRKDPDVESAISSVGGGFGMGGSNTGRSWVQLKPRRQRTATVGQIVERLRPKVSRFPGLRVFMTVPAAIRIGGRPSKSQYDFTVQGPETNELYQQAQKLERALTQVRGIQDVTSDLQIRTPRVRIDFDRDKVAALQLNTARIQSGLYNAFGPRWSSTIYAPNNQYRVLLEMLPKFQEHADYLSKLYFKGTGDQMIPLSTFTRLTTDAGPQTINHSGQLPSVTISFNLRPGVALGDAVADIQDVAKRTLSDRMTTSFQGAAREFQSSFQNLSLLLVLAVAVVYIVLGMLYESYIHPITILSGLPSAGVGALLTLLVFGVDLNIYAFVGLMMLIGIVKKNAIMQIDCALDLERREGKTPTEAIYEGCLIRFRPIMMTTMAALLGALPISLGWGAGGEARRPLGLTVAGGLLFSQLITLFLTPVVYTYLDGLVSWWGSWGRRAARPVEALPSGDALRAPE